MDMKIFSKGQIWWYKCPPYDVEEWEDGMLIADRYVIIYQGEVIGSPNKVMAIPSSTSGSCKNGVGLQFEFGKNSKALIQYMKPIHVKYLKKFVGQLNRKMIEELDLAVSVYLGLTYDDDIIRKYFPRDHSCSVPGEYMFVQSNLLNTASPVIFNTETNDQAATIFTRRTTLKQESPTSDSKLQEIQKKKTPRWSKPIPENFATIAKQVFDGEITSVEACTLCNVSDPTFNKWYKTLYSSKPKKRKPNTTKKSGPHIVSKTRTAIDLTTLSVSDLQWFMGADVKTICAKYNISTATAYSYRKKILNQNLIPCVTDYGDRVYQQFAGKKLNLLSKEDKTLFIKLNPEKLDKITGLGITTINTYMQRFTSEIKKTTAGGG